MVLTRTFLGRDSSVLRLRHVHRHPSDVFLGIIVSYYDIDRAGGVLPSVNDKKWTMRWAW